MNTSRFGPNAFWKVICALPNIIGGKTSPPNPPKGGLGRIDEGTAPWAFRASLRFGGDLPFATKDEPYRLNWSVRRCAWPELKLAPVAPQSFLALVKFSVKQIRLGNRLLFSRPTLTTTIFLALLFASLGCSDTSIGPMAGMWQGQFSGEAINAKEPMRPEWTYKGYLQLYATGMKFKMHLESQAQIVDATGTWSHKKEKIYVTAKDVQFDDLGGKLLQKPGIVPIDPEKVREALSHTLVFSYSDKPQKLEGLKITLGPMVGRFDFTKGQE